MLHDLNQLQGTVVVVGNQFDEQQAGCMQQLLQQFLEDQDGKDYVELRVVVLQLQQRKRVLQGCLQLLH